MTTDKTRALPSVSLVNWPRECRRLASYVMAGNHKKATAMAGALRLWTQDTGQEIRVGRHGKSEPILTVPRG